MDIGGVLGETMTYSAALQPEPFIVAQAVQFAENALLSSKAPSLRELAPPQGVAEGVRKKARAV